MTQHLFSFRYYNYREKNTQVFFVFIKVNKCLHFFKIKNTDTRRPTDIGALPAGSYNFFVYAFIPKLFSRRFMRFPVFSRSHTCQLLEFLTEFLGIGKTHIFRNVFYTFAALNQKSAAFGYFSFLYIACICHSYIFYEHLRQVSKRDVQIFGKIGERYIGHIAVAHVIYNFFDRGRIILRSFFLKIASESY